MDDDTIAETQHQVERLYVKERAGCVMYQVPFKLKFHLKKYTAARVT